MISAPPCSVSSDLGQLVVIRHLISGIDWAIAGAAMLAAPATPIPVTLIKSRRFIELPSPCDDLCQPSLRRFSAAWNIHSRISTLISHVATQKTRRPATPGLGTQLKSRLAAGARADHD